MKEHLRRYGALVAFVAMMASFSPASAGGVTVTLNPSLSSTSPQDVQIQWTASGQYVTGTTVTVTADPTFTSIRDNCGGTTDSDLNNDSVADGSVTATTTNSATYTVTTSTGATLTMNLCLTFAFSTSSRSYAISILSSNPVDFGSTALNSNGGNTVLVTGTVPSSLAFSIRNRQDTADTNVCPFGVLSISSTSTCNYRLRISTNAANGFQVKILANHDFATGNATMTNVVNDGPMPTAGTESYGLTQVVGAETGGRNTTTLLFTNPIVVNNPPGYTFGTNPSPVPTTVAQNFISYGAAFQAGNPPSVTTTSFVEHGVAISAGTAAGLYTQLVTYTLTGSF